MQRCLIHVVLAVDLRVGLAQKILEQLILAVLSTHVQHGVARRTQHFIDRDSIVLVDLD